MAEQYVLFYTQDGILAAAPASAVIKFLLINSAELTSEEGRYVVHKNDKKIIIHAPDQARMLQSSNSLEVIVYQQAEQLYGMVIDEILDIVSSLPTEAKLFELRYLLQSETIIEESNVKINEPEEAEKPEKPLEKYVYKGPESNHILLITPNPFFRKLMQPILENAGFKVTAKETAADTLDWLAEGSIPAAILLDLDVPHIQHDQFITACRDITRCEGLPVIALAGEASPKIESDLLFTTVSKSDRTQLLEALAAQPLAA